MRVNRKILSRTTVLVAALTTLGLSVWIVLGPGKPKAVALSPDAGVGSRGIARPEAPKGKRTLAVVQGHGRLEQGIEAGASLSTTWTARVFEDATGLPVKGVELRMRLLPPDSTFSELRLVTDEKGVVGPIAIDWDQTPAAEVAISPGPSWAAAYRDVCFQAGAANRTEFGLAPPAILTVKAIDASTGRQMANVELQLATAEGRVMWEAFTGTDGLYERPWATTGGPFVLTARRQGYALVFGLQWSRPPTTSLTAELLLQRAGELRVSVTDGAGQSVHGVGLSVDLAHAALPAAKAQGTTFVKEPVFARSVSPWAIIEGLPCGVTLRVQANAESGVRAAGWVTIPSTSGHAELSLVIDDAPGLRVLVQDHQGVPLVAARVGLDSKRIGETNDAGWCTIPEAVAGGAREVWAITPGRALVWQPLLEPNVPIRLVLPKEALLAGKVVDVDGAPQRYVRLTPMLGLEGGELERQARGKLLMAQLELGDALRTERDGSFELGGLSTQALDLLVRPPKTPAFHEKDLYPGLGEVLIRLPSESDYGKSFGVKLRLSVVEQHSLIPIPGCSVSVFRSSSATAPNSVDSRTSRTNEAGQAEVSFAIEGLYWAVVDADGYLPMNTELLEYPVGQFDLQVPLEACGSLVITVLNQNGLAASAVFLSALDRNGEGVEFKNSENGMSWSRSYIQTDAAGRAGANRVPVGKLTVNAWSGPGAESKIVSSEVVRIRPGELSTLEMRIP